MKRMLRFTVSSLFILLVAQILSAAEVNLTNEGNVAAQINWGKPINVQIKDMLLPDALSLLLKDTGITYKVDPDVEVLKVTADFRGVSLQRALTELGRVSNTVITLTSDSISMGEDSWITGLHTAVSVKKRLDPSVSAHVKSRDATVPVDAQAIPLKYYTPVDIIEMLELPNWLDFLRGTTSVWTKASGPLPSSLPKEITSISVRPNSNALLVTGEESAVAELTQLISKIDVEPRQTRQISIHITRYTLGSIIPESLELLEVASQSGGVMVSWATKSQLDALTSELRDKGIEPTVVANIATLDSFPVSAEVFGGGAISSPTTPPVRSIRLQVMPRLGPEDNRVVMTIEMQSSVAEESGQVTRSFGSTIMGNPRPGESMVIFEPSDSPCGGALTIITATL